MYVGITIAEDHTDRTDEYWSRDERILVIIAAPP